MRFLFEEICKVIDPVKPETMLDVRNKIGLETDLESPELIELLVDNKIISNDLPIKQVYEQVHWPAVCRQRNADVYEIPSIDDAPRD